MDGVSALPIDDVRALGFGSALKASSDLTTRVRAALDEIAGIGVRVSYPAVAEKVGVAKSTLYRNREVVRMIDAARDASRSLPRRLDADAHELAALREEVAMLRAENEYLRGMMLQSRHGSKVEYFFGYLLEAA